MNPDIKQKIKAVIDTNLVDYSIDNNNVHTYRAIKWVAPAQWPERPAQKKYGLRAAWRTLIGGRNTETEQYGVRRVELMKISKDNTSMHVQIKINNIIVADTHIRPQNLTQAEKDILEIYNLCEQKYKAQEEAGHGCQPTPCEMMTMRYLDKILSNQK